MQDYEARKAEAGLKEIRRLYLHPDDFEAVRLYAAKLTRRREREAARARSSS